MYYKNSLLINDFLNKLLLAHHRHCGSKERSNLINVTNLHDVQLTITSKIKIMTIKTILSIALLVIALTSCSSNQYNTYRTTKNYKPDNPELYQEIVNADSLFFNAYNTCEKNLDTYAAYFSDNIEFYHDKGGIMTSKPDIIAATKKNICGKVTRELVKGSIEVYPIKDFGAIEMGLHKFHNSAEPNAISKAGRFMVVWKSENKTWKIVRVVSLH